MKDVAISVNSSDTPSMGGVMGGGAIVQVSVLVLGVMVAAVDLYLVAP